MSFHFVLMSIARSKWSILRKLHKITNAVLQKSLSMWKKKCFSFHVNPSRAAFFRLLELQGARTKILGTIILGTKIRPEKILPVCKHILQMILRYT